MPSYRLLLPVLRLPQAKQFEEESVVEARLLPGQRYREVKQGPRHCQSPEDSKGLSCYDAGAFQSR